MCISRPPGSYASRSSSTLFNMFYYLYELRDLWSPLNVFRYITVRAGGALVTALALSVLLGPPLIRKVRDRAHGQTDAVRVDQPPVYPGLRLVRQLFGSDLSGR